TDDPGIAQHTLHVLMLMTVKHEPGLRTFNVLVKGGKSDVYLIFTIMHVARRIVRDENVHGRKARQKLLNLAVIKEVIATRLVFPGTTKSAEPEAPELEDFHVQVPNWGRKWGAGIVVALDCNDFTAMTAFRRFEDYKVRKISA